LSDSSSDDNQINDEVKKGGKLPNSVGIRGCMYIPTGPALPRLQIPWVLSRHPSIIDPRERQKDSV
jgi:hypothetical protein